MRVVGGALAARTRQRGLRDDKREGGIRVPRPFVFDKAREGAAVTPTIPINGDGEGRLVVRRLAGGACPADERHGGADCTTAAGAAAVRRVAAAGLANAAEDHRTAEPQQHHHHLRDGVRSRLQRQPLHRWCVGIGGLLRCSGGSSGCGRGGREAGRLSIGLCREAVSARSPTGTTREEGRGGGVGGGKLPEVPIRGRILRDAVH